MSREGNKAKKVLSVILGLLSALFIISAIVIAVKHYFPVKENFSEYKTRPEPVVRLPQNPIDFDALKEQNDDVCGWIKFEGDDIAVDYPILRASENEDEDYYLRRGMDKKYATAGTVYIQKVNAIDFSDPCTIVYGHNMRNLSMFGTLKYLRDKEVFNRNRYFYIYSPGHIFKYEIKSAFVYDNRHIYYSFNFDVQDGFDSFAETASNPPSLVKNVREDVEIKSDSRLAVLSTCTNVDGERYIVVGVLASDTKTE